MFGVVTLPCASFPSLYSIVDTKRTKAVEVWVWEGGSGAWNRNFTRPFIDWELETVQNFIGVLSTSSISTQRKNILVWKGDDTSCFTVKSYFNLLKVSSPLLGSIKILWNHYVLTKVGFLLGRLGGVRFLSLVN